MIKGKIISMIALDAVLFVLLVLGFVLMNNESNPNGSPAMFSLLLLVWIFIVVLDVPLIKAKEKSKFLKAITWIQIFLTPLNIIICSIYLIVKADKNDLSVELKGKHDK